MVHTGKLAHVRTIITIPEAHLAFRELGLLLSRDCLLVCASLHRMGPQHGDPKTTRPVQTCSLEESPPSLHRHIDTKVWYALN